MKGIIKETNEKLRSRIYNWKFEQAKQYLEGENEEVVNIINSLSNMMGDCGWGDGDMGLLISIAVEHLIGPEEE